MVSLGLVDRMYDSISLGLIRYIILKLLIFTIVFFVRCIL